VKRFAILLAALGALMLVPAAQAFAAPSTVTVIPIGEGSGEVSSVGEGFEGSLPIECSYDGETEEASGQCGPSDMTAEEEFEALNLAGTAAQGSELVEWEVEGAAGTTPNPCNLKFPCSPFAFEGEEAEVTVFALFEPCEEGSEAESCQEAATEFPLTTVIKGGPGTIVSDPAGIECTGPVNTECEADFEEGTEVTLTASPSAGYRFFTWASCPSIDGRQCTVTMSEAKEVRAIFLKTSTLTVSKAEGSELGIVKSNPGGAICYFACSSAAIAYDQGSEVTVFTNAPKFRHFVEFTGGTGQAEACNGETSCSFTADGTDSSIEALFVEDEKATLSVDKEGGGQAKLTIGPASVVCVNSCAATTADFYTEPTPEEATLEWDLGNGTSSIDFGAGVDGCTGKSEADTGECTVTMDEAHALTATLE
jgi:hypothetical protein